MNVWTPIFSAGTHTTASGETFVFTEKDLDKAVSQFDPKHHEPPLVIGHPETDSPSYGWVKALKREGGVLYARLRQVPEAVKALIREGRYKKKSAAFYRDGSLRHVGLLGAAPPSVKGLGDIKFSGDGGREFQVFSEPEKPKEGDSDMSKTVEKLQAELDAKDKELKAEREAKEAAETKATEADKKAKDLEADQEKKDKEFAEKQATQAAKAREDKVDELIAAGKVLPVDKYTILAFAEKLSGAGEICFSEGDTEVKKAGAAAFLEFLEKRDSHGLFHEFAQKPRGEGGGEAQATGNFAADF